MFRCDGSSGTLIFDTPVQISLDVVHIKELHLANITRLVSKAMVLFGLGEKNNYGQLGDSTTISSSVPIQITSDYNWKMAACGLDFTIAIKNDGSLLFELGK